MARRDISDAFNTLYKDLFDKSKDVRVIREDKEYKNARSYVDKMAGKLDAGVLEFLSVLAFFKPNAKIQFFNSKADALSLICCYDDIERVLKFNDNGQIIYDNTLQKDAKEKE